jgi:5-methylcytosine-specific restriction endonuclease McrA
VDLAALCSARAWRRRAREELRDAEAADRGRDRRYDVPGLEAWLEVAPGSPLGPGVPGGGVLREDGESHHEWWTRVLRMDVCAYCGMAGGTVDHVEPKASGRPYVHRWSNLVGACGQCNGRKAAKPLLLWLRSRPRRRVHAHDGGASGDPERGVQHRGGGGDSVAHAMTIGRRAAA